jgi:hypothetical protein
LAQTFARGLAIQSCCFYTHFQADYYFFFSVFYYSVLQLHSNSAAAGNLILQTLRAMVEGQKHGSMLEIAACH